MADGGTISKVRSKYYKVDSFTLKEGEVKDGKEWVLAMYKAVEGYLIQNPDAYACYVVFSGSWICDFPRTLIKHIYLLFIFTINKFLIF